MRTRNCLLLTAGLLAAPTVAQKVDLHIVPAQGTVRYEVASKSDVSTERKIMIDGQAMEGRGGRGPGGGASSTAISLVFDENAAGGWRRYTTAQASVTRPGRDGGEQTDDIESGLVGKRLFLEEDDEGVHVREGSADGEDVQRQLSANVPATLALEGLTPAEPVEVGAEFELAAPFRDALAGFVHPITPAREPRSDSDDGAQGGSRGGRGRGRGPRGARDSALRTLANQKLDVAATGKVVSVEDDIATVAITGTFSGEGTPAELGMFGGRGGRFGRGGRGGRGGGGSGDGSDSGKAKVSVAFEGTMLVDVAAHQLRGLKLAGKVATNSDSTRTMGRDGEEREFEMHSTSSGTFTLSVAASSAGSDK